MDAKDDGYGDDHNGGDGWAYTGLDRDIRHASAMPGIWLPERAARGLSGDDTEARNLHLTVLIDHDVVDGVPVGRFVDDLPKRIEEGCGPGG